MSREGFNIAILLRAEIRGVGRSIGIPKTRCQTGDLGGQRSRPNLSRAWATHLPQFTSIAEENRNLLVKYCHDWAVFREFNVGLEHPRHAVREFGRNDNGSSRTSIANAPG